MHNHSDIPYGRQSVSEEDIGAVSRVLQSDWLTMGPIAAEFEKEIAHLSKTESAVAVSSGTAALHCAYSAMNFQKGDEVITSPLTFVATASTAVLQGARIVFADIQTDTGNIDPKSAEAEVTDRTKVIAAVDFAGHPVDCDEISEICEKSNLIFLEDSAHSIGSTYKGRPVGSLADVTTFSFFPTKNMTSGEGGAIVALNSEILAAASRYKSHGLVRDKEHQRNPEEGIWHQEVQEFGLNYRLPDVLCALGLNQIRRLNEFKSARTRIFNRYIEGLSDLSEIILPAKRDYVDPMWHLFPIRILENRRKKIFEYMRNHGILVQVNYIPVYWHPVFEDLGYQKGMCPEAELYYSQEISLPMFAGLTENQQDRVIQTLRQALKV